MEEAFIIIQIGDAQLDAVCDKAIIPAIQRAGLTARRVDRHNTGDLLKSEIVAFIERSQIIVADLTNERPNCYLEVGYAMGLGKKKNLILTVREDHHHTSENYKKGGPKVHFDLEGYELLFWHPDKLDEFRDELTKRIKRRIAVVQAPEQTVEGVDTSWIDELRERADQGLNSLGRRGYMEVTSALRPAGSWKQQDLLGAVRESQIHTFGWPIAPIIDRDEAKPAPTADGVQAEVKVDNGAGLGHKQYDLWQLRRDGSFFIRTSLFEDERAENAVFFNTRIVRTTEAVLLLARVYSRLGVAEDTEVTIELCQGGLKGRSLSAVGNRFMFNKPVTQEDQACASVTKTLQRLETDLVEVVKELLSPLFVLFEFFALQDEVWEQIVNDFVAGKVT